MQIRDLLFIAFFFIMVIATLLSASVTFLLLRYTLEKDIGQKLTNDAQMLMEEVDLLLYERFQNIHSWSRLDIMQDARIGDIDKRLSHFLSEVDNSYQGMYQGLFYVDDKQKVIAASSSNLIGTTVNNPHDVVTVHVPNGQVFIEETSFSPPPNEKTNIIIRASVQDSFSASILGQLYGLFDMQQLFLMLGKASAGRFENRYIVLLDSKGRTIATSTNLHIPKYLLNTAFVDWKPNANESFFIRKNELVSNVPLVVGYWQSKGYRNYGQLGWSTLVFQGIDQAFLPVRSLWNIFTAIITLTMVISYFAALWVAGRIAKPLHVLTRWVRNIQMTENQAPPKVGGIAEIRELEKTFSNMLKEVISSRAKVVESIKMAAVGEMSANMAHEIRTPLGIISTSAQLLKRDEVLSDESQEMAQLILEECTRLTGLVTTLLECSSPREPKMLKHNIHSLINHSLQLIMLQSQQKNIEIEQDFLAQDPILECDYELMTQVFLNLLLNAVQLMPPNSRVWISSFSDKRFIILEFADNGPGIADKDYPFLFEPFFTKREGGIGLGLAVTKQIILAHNGEISVQKSQWGGACFSLKLPKTQE
jgi:two-component system, NtrC family, sensor histidine kinase HydH